ncbi:MAG: Eco57I restriction-modification methylase domain-containing protein [Opitutales bacterium]|nr:Eco57I restriction-modification methylase domain-containing protein [Opitutales bacterium]
MTIPLSEGMGPDATHFWAESDAESRGEVFTKPEVAEFILDLSGWKVGGDLLSKRLLEPSCGSGDFVLPALRRLLADAPGASVETLMPCICAVEVNRSAFETLRERVRAELAGAGFADSGARRLMAAWLHQADFLTQPFSGSFTQVVGNPPYLRIESLPRSLMARYRDLFRTMYDRADLYIAFFEKGLSLLGRGGRLGFICANRWIKNRYGGPLREMIADGFHMETYVDFTGVDAFHGEVIAYPAVTIITNAPGSATQVIEKEHVKIDVLPVLAERILSGTSDHRIRKVHNVASGAAPWLLSNASRLRVIQDLEQRLPTLEEAGCRVGIGVASGADKVYIGSDADLDVEPARKLPILTRRDLRNNRIEWTGKFILNPYAEEGMGNGMVDIDAFPRFKAYLLRHREVIERRHVAKKNPAAWFKTIDRIYPALTRTPKLVIPDIQGAHQVAYDCGEYYPHHNLYFVTATEWDLRALQTVLRSRLARAFVATYSLRMRGDFLRFQAQYLRRIRLPRWSAVSPDQQDLLRALCESDDPERIDQAVRCVYGIDEADWLALSND